MDEEQIINPADFPRPEGGIQPTDKLIGMRGQVPFGATPDDVSALVPYVGENILANTARHSGQWWWFASDQAMPLMRSIKAGTTYTISVDVVSVSGEGFSLVLAPQYDAGKDIMYTLQITASDIGKRVSMTFAPTRNYDVGAIVCGMGSNVNGGTIDNIKLEVGSKATPYMPNPADIARAIDYSLLTEQETGDFWVDTNGVKKQVYTRTWIGTTPSAWSVYGAGQSYEFKYFVLPDSKSGYSAVWLEVGMIGAPVTGAVLNTIPLKNTNPIQLTYSDFLGGIIVSTNETAGLTSQPYSITAKCIK